VMMDTVKKWHKSFPLDRGGRKELQYTKAKDNEA
jgi:hypothetical protein